MLGLSATLVARRKSCRSLASLYLLTISVHRTLARPVRLLLVEDNPTDVMLLTIGLKEADAAYTLQVAEDGQKALDLLTKVDHSAAYNFPDLIFLDLNLPRLSGHDVLARIKADPRLRLIPVVILTSSQARADVTSAYSRGASSYLQKPTTLQETLDLMRTVEHYWLDLAILPEGPG
jgi:chemotaxis family two-component system response regulator Rcp1